MSQKSLAIAVIRLLGVYCIVKVIGDLSVILTTLGHLLVTDGITWDGVQWTVLPFTVPVVVLLGLAVGLWMGAERLARRLRIDDEQPGTGGPIEQTSLYALAFVATGVALLAWNVPYHVASCIMNIVHARTDAGTPYPGYWTGGAWINGIHGGVYLVLAACLIFGGRSLARLIGKLRRP